MNVLRFWLALVPQSVVTPWASGSRPARRPVSTAEDLGLLSRELSVGEDTLPVQLAELAAGSPRR
jgi:hypothetical protein